MKSIYFIIAFVSGFVFNSCDNQELDMQEVTIIGTWEDVNEYQTTIIVDGVEQPQIHSKIQYEIKENGTFTVSDNDIPSGLHNDGTWVLNEETNILQFKESLDPSLPIVNQSTEWHILQLNATTLEVDYTFKQDSIQGIPSFEKTTYRQFARQ